MAADTQFDAPTQRSRRPEHVQAHKQHVHCRFRRACESSTHDGCSKRFIAACVRRRMSRPLNLLRLHAQTTRQSIRRRAVERGSTAARAPESRALSTQRRCWTALFCVHQAKLAKIHRGVTDRHLLCPSLARPCVRLFSLCPALHKHKQLPCPKNCAPAAHRKTFTALP